MTPTIPRPPYDPAYKTSAGLPGLGGKLDVVKMRGGLAGMNATASSICEANPAFVHTEHEVSVPSITGAGAGSTTQLSIFTPRNSSQTKRAVVCYVHGGGQILGDRFTGVESLLPFFPERDDMVYASIEYRLAPEDPAPAAAHDCYAGLEYLSSHAAELCIDPAKVIVFGSSGGAGVAASAVLLARQRGKELVCAQMLNVPMLDDRTHYNSAQQFYEGGIWDGSTNEQAWGLILGSDAGKDVDEIRCAGRATNLGGLPPTFIDVGECEVFRDSAIAFASGIWRDGGSAELHVWPGVHHGAMLEPEVTVSKAQVAAQKDFIKRVLRF